MFTICIDAGHYKKTTGRRCPKVLDVHETREWELNRRVADALQELLKSYGCATVRADDPTGNVLKSLAERVSAAEKAKADCYISIHHNAGVKCGKGGGTVVYTAPGCSEKSLSFRDAAYHAVVKQTGLDGNRATPLATASYYVLTNTTMPAILIECGFMDSSTDVPIILGEDFAGKVAMGLLEAIKAVFGLSKKGTQDHMKKTIQNGVHIVETPAREFGIALVDKAKRNITGVNYSNAGFFGNYNEKRAVFTLPVGHLNCDFLAESEWVKHYCNLRGKLQNGRFAYVEPKKALSTLYIRAGMAYINELDKLPEDCSYAISGVPVMRNGAAVSWAKAQAQGWEVSSLYATWHIFAGVKSDHSRVFVMAFKTKTGNLVASKEAYLRFKALGFTDVIKVDGGGSTIMRTGGKTDVSTVGNRRICTIFLFGGNPYAPATKTLRRKSTGESVKWLQWELNDRGFNCDIDGSFGPGTDMALRAYQISVGLAPDGSCGPATRKSLLA